MRVLAVNDIVQARFWSTYDGQAAVSVFNYAVTSLDIAPATDIDFAKNLSAAAAADYIALLANTVTFDGIQVQIVSPGPLLTSVVNTDDAGPGTGGAFPLPRQTAGVLSWLTNQAGPGYRGRTFLPFPGHANDFPTEHPPASYITAMDQLALDLQNFDTVDNDGRGANVVFCLYHRESAPNYTTISGHISRAKWATQKRRGDYGKLNSSPIGV